MRFVSPQVGRVLLKGMDLNDFALRELRGDAVVLIPQTATLFHGTVRFNLGSSTC